MQGRAATTSPCPADERVPDRSSVVVTQQSVCGQLRVGRWFGSYGKPTAVDFLALRHDLMVVINVRGLFPLFLSVRELHYEQNSLHVVR